MGFNVFRLFTILFYQIFLFCQGFFLLLFTYFLTQCLRAMPVKNLIYEGEKQNPVPVIDMVLCW